MDSQSISTDYFKKYRTKLGFSNQNLAKDFFGAKDVTPTIDFAYIELLNKRLFLIAEKINETVASEIKVANLFTFQQEKIIKPFEAMKDAVILPKLNNQGRRPEQVYFSWMRGFVCANYFLKSLGLVFKTDISQISLIGDDDFSSIETFKRTPKADLEIALPNKERLRLEIQSGFTGINDIKQHKVLEAKKVANEQGIATTAIHFDIYNEQVAFVKLDEIEDNNINWITRQQMEGQTVFNIEQNYFVWKLLEPPVKYQDISFGG